MTDETLGLYVRLAELAWQGVSAVYSAAAKDGVTPEDLERARHQLGTYYPDPKAPITPPAEPPPAAASYGVVLDAQPDDATLSQFTRVYYRGDGKWFAWRIGVFIDPEELGFSLHHIVE